MEKETNHLGTPAANDGSLALQVISWIFGLAFFAIGVVNTCWGNDTGFGIFILLLSLVYLLPVNAILKRLTGFTIPRIGLVKILLALFILWAAMGVGELFDKVELMMHSL